MCNTTTQNQDALVDPAGSQTSGTAASAVLERLRAICLRRGDNANAEWVASLSERLETQTFNLVVFGEFKRGKTTFINALIGDDLLPSAVVPLTSVVTILHYSPAERIEVEFLDGSTRIVPRAELHEYVTEKRNPENVKGVKVVRAGIPCELLENGMQLVDTPGVGSVYDHNTEATRDFLPHVDGAILLVASDPPISRGECEFLLEMRPHVARLFVVQNKIDQLRPQDLEESLSFTRGVLKQVLGNGGVQVFPVSAREALEARQTQDTGRYERSRMGVFVDELRRFQADEQSQTLERSVVNGALQVVEDEKLGLNLEQQALRMSVGEIEERYARFVQRRDAIMAQREDDIVLIRAAARKLIQRTIQHDYEQERKRQAPLLRERFMAWMDAQGDLPAREILPRASEFIKQTLFEVLSEWRRAEERHLEQELAGSLERFTERTNDVLSDIYQSAREVFELPPRSVETVGYLSARSRFLWREWDWEPRLGLSGSLLVHVLPGARKRLAQASLSALLEEHDRACGRLRHDFAERAQAAFDDYVRSLNHALEEALGGIDRAITRVIAQKQSVSEDAAQAEQRLLDQVQELDAIESALRLAVPPGVGNAA